MEYFSFNVPTKNKLLLYL